MHNKIPFNSFQVTPNTQRMYYGLLAGTNEEQLPANNRSTITGGQLL